MGRIHLGRPSAGSVLGGLALLVAMGMGTAVAAGSFVTIKDGNSQRTVNVSPGGKLVVGDGAGAIDVTGGVTVKNGAAPLDVVGGVTVDNGAGPLAVTGDVTAPVARPADIVRGSTEHFGGTCNAVLTAAAGKAVVVTDITATAYSNAREGLAFRLFVSPTSSPSPCNSGFVALLPTLPAGPLALTSGLIVPAGSALYLNQYNFDGGAAFRGTLTAFGYTVPAGSVSPSRPTVTGGGRGGAVGDN